MVAGAEVVERKTESNRLDSASITYLAIKGRNRCAEWTDPRIAGRHFEPV